jgi:hypothetical protein
MMQRALRDATGNIITPESASIMVNFAADPLQDVLVLIWHFGSNRDRSACSAPSCTLQGRSVFQAKAATPYA